MIYRQIETTRPAGGWSRPNDGGLMRPFVIAAIIATLSSTLVAQTAAVRDAPAAAIGRGWTALAEGRPAEAISAARQVLRRDPGNHDALSLGIAAMTSGQQSTAALDLYEQWLTTSRHEDLFPLQSIARSFLIALSKSAEPRVRIAALMARVEAGDRAAQQLLERESQSDAPPLELDAALAAAGDRGAVRRLETQVTAGGPRDKTAEIRALVDGKSAGSSAAIAQALTDPAPPTRIAAAGALADLGAADAVPQLRAALNDQNPAVRYMVRVALARLGDPDGATVLRELAASPVSEYRLLAARIAAGQDPDGTWSAAVLPLLQDADPMIRIRAADLLIQHGKAEDAEPALDAALGDPTPFMRTQAVRLLGTSLAGSETALTKVRSSAVETARKHPVKSVFSLQVLLGRATLSEPPATPDTSRENALSLPSREFHGSTANWLPARSCGRSASFHRQRSGGPLGTHLHTGNANRAG
jgi:tetratricopeptide (TPR) repeat protein